MRKLILIILIVATAVMFTACDGVSDNDNYSNDIVKGNVVYTHAYINVGGDFVNVEISRWGFFDARSDVIQLELKDGTILVVDAENCILYNGTLPTGMTAFEQRVIEYACKEMDWNTQEVSTLTLVHTEYVPWLKCECYTYILTLADGSRWLVSAGENEDGFDCDVECEV